VSFLFNGDCLDILPIIPDGLIDFVLTDPPYLVNYQDRSGRSIANDVSSDWLEPAFAEIFRVLRQDALCVSFYGWNRVDQFFHAWKSAGFRVVGHLVFTKRYASKARFVEYRHEAAYLLAKGSPALPERPLPDVLGWTYSGNRHHPTEKSPQTLVPLIEAFTQPQAIVLDPFAGSGSTCLAACQAGRRYVGIELDPGYHAAALSRLAHDAPATHLK
jgi:adenine-specific DNA-methyltransferase